MYWYNHGRPSASLFFKIIPRVKSVEYPEEFLTSHFRIPGIAELRDMIETVFIPRGNKLDFDARQQVDECLVQEKVVMFKRHATIGGKMQDMAIQFLEEHKDDLGVSNAVKLLVEGLRIERESMGVPAAIQRMTTMTDEQLMKEIKSLVAKSPIDLSVSEPRDDEANSRDFDNPDDVIIDGEITDA